MNVLAVIHANLEYSPIGTPSRLAESLVGQPVLRRTVQRLVQSEKIERIVVTCPSHQLQTVSDLIDNPQIKVQTFDGPAYPRESTVRSARKWALQSWRGGLGNSCFFDEHTHPILCLQLASQYQPDAILTLAAEGPLIDPALTDDMISYYEKNKSDTRLVFAQAPPGLAPTLFEPYLLKEIVDAGLVPGWINAYRPDAPQRDIITLPTCYRPALPIIHASGRLVGDTQRGWDVLNHIYGVLGENPSAETICRHLLKISAQQPEPFPAEIQIELTTQDQHHQTILRPRGPQVGQRGPMPVDLFQKIIRQAAEHDDMLIVLGGFGEPLLHPQFIELLKICRNEKIFGLTVRSNGIALNDVVIQALMENQVDVLQMMVDATTPQKYCELHGCDEFEKVRANIQRLNQLRQNSGNIFPLTFASLVKARETFDELDPFYDDWVRQTGWAIIEGYSRHAGLWPDRQVMSMAPPRRESCRQLRSRMTILANGDVVGCDQDFKGSYVIGNARTDSLRELWGGQRLAELRQAHQRENYELHPMCPSCDEWHRP